MWPNLLDQRYTYSISNIWLNVPSPLVAVFDIYLQASGIVNPSSWQNRWSSTEFVGFLTQACFISTIHVFSMRFRTLWEPFQNNNPSLIDPFLYNFWCVFGIIVLLEQPTVPKPRCSTDDFRFYEEIGDNSPALFHLICYEQHIHWLTEQPHRILPVPCWTVDVVTFSSPDILLLIVTKQLFFVISCISCLFILSSWRFFLCLCDQQQTSVKL